jgi:hypothetical protein
MQNKNESERRVDTIELGQKVAVLESLIAGMRKEMDTFSELLKEHMEKEEEERKVIMQNLNEIKLGMTNYKGIITGITIAAAVVSTIISFAIAIAVKFL